MTCFAIVGLTIDCPLSKCYQKLPEVLKSPVPSNMNNLPTLNVTILDLQKG